MRKSQLRSGLRGFGGVSDEDVIIPPAQRVFETAHSPDLDPQLAAMLDPAEYESLVKHRSVMNGMQIKQYRHVDQVQANAIQKANLKALQRRESVKTSQYGRRHNRRKQQSLTVQPPAQQGEQYSGSKATPLQQQARDGRHISSTGHLPIAPPAQQAVKENLLRGTTWGEESLPTYQDRGSEPFVSEVLGVNLRPVDPLVSRQERVAPQRLSIGAPPPDVSSAVPVPSLERTMSASATKTSGRKAPARKAVSRSTAAKKSQGKK